MENTPEYKKGWLEGSRNHHRTTAEAMCPKEYTSEERLIFIEGFKAGARSEIMSGTC